MNGAIALGVPLAVLVARGAASAGRDGRVWPRLRDLAEGVALPFALQGLYLIALPLRDRARRRARRRRSRTRT